MNRVLRKWLLLPLLVGDCALNVILRGSFNETLSARAHRLRVQAHKYWGWTADAIDAFFVWDPNHCRSQFELEQKHGGVWKAWVAQ